MDLGPPAGEQEVGWLTGSCVWLSRRGMTKRRCQAYVDFRRWVRLPLSLPARRRSGRDKRKGGAGSAYGMLGREGGAKKYNRTRRERKGKEGGILGGGGGGGEGGGGSLLSWLLGTEPKETEGERAWEAGRRGGLGGVAARQALGQLGFSAVVRRPGQRAGLYLRGRRPR